MKKNVIIPLRFPEITLLGTLILLLSVPLVVGLSWKHDDSLQKQENRKMAELPAISLFQSNPKKYIHSLDSFLKDRVGFRHLANGIYRKMRYYIFKDPPLHNINIGKDGFVFMNSHRLDKPNLIYSFLCEQQVEPSEKLLISVDRTFSNVTQYYTNRGYDVTITAAPTNVVLYPDKLPLTVDKEYRESCKAYDTAATLLGKLQEKSNVDGSYKLFYPYELFKIHRDEPYFFPKEKWHWTGRSAYLFARNLTYQTGVLDTLKLDDHNVPELVSDDLAMFFGFERRIKALTYPYEEFTTKIEWPSWQYELSARGGLKYYTTSNALSKKRALLLANSFGNELAPHLAVIFEHFYFYNLNFIKKDEEAFFFSDIVNRTKPDYIYILFDDAGIIAAPKRLAAFTDLLKQ